MSAPDDITGVATAISHGDPIAPVLFGVTPILVAALVGPAAIVLMVIVTNFAIPPTLKELFTQDGGHPDMEDPLAH